MLISATLTESRSEFAPVLFQGDLVKNIYHAKDIGFGGVEIHIGNTINLEKNSIKKALSDTELVLTTLATGRSYLEDKLSFCHPDKKIRQSAVTRIKKIIDFFADYHPMIIIGLIRGILANSHSKSDGINWICEALEECTKYAAEHNITILIEAANRFELDWLHTGEDVRKVIEQIKLPNLKLLLDTFHMNIEEHSLTEPLRSNSLILNHIHLSDNNRHYPGAGIIDFRSIFNVLREIGYNGTIAVECLPLPDPDTAAKEALITIWKNLHE